MDVHYIQIVNRTLDRTQCASIRNTIRLLLYREKWLFSLRIITEQISKMSRVCAVGPDSTRCNHCAFEG
jgi:hypothetical protein